MHITHIDSTCPHRDEAVQFLNQLMQEYPLTNTERFCFSVKPSNYTTQRAGCTNIQVSDFNKPAITTINIKLSKVATTKARLLDTIAHEYCHALQHDQRFDLINTKGKKMCEVEADLFGIQRAAAYLKVPMEEILKEAVIYEQTRAHIKLWGTLEAAIANCPKLNKLKPWVK